MMETSDYLPWAAHQLCDNFFLYKTGKKKGFFAGKFWQSFTLVSSWRSNPCCHRVDRNQSEALRVFGAGLNYRQLR